MEGYNDVDYITDNLDIKSITGYIFLLGGTDIS